MENSKRTTERRGSLVVLTLTIVIISAIVISGICVGLLTEGETTKIILFVLLLLLAVLGLGSCLFVEFQRKKAIRKRDRSAELWLQQTLDEQRRTASAPPMNARTSWALTIPWKHDSPGHRPHGRSPGNSLPPYSPPHSDIS